MEEPLTWLQMVSRLVPSYGYHIQEPRNPHPKILKFEGARLAGTPVIEEQEWAMIR
jgi:hypothetical protein